MALVFTPLEMWLQSRSGGGSPLIRPPNRSNSPRGACRGWVGPLLSPERPRGHPVLGPENAATARGPSFLEGVLSSQGGCSCAWHGLRRPSARRFGLPRRFRDVPSFFAHLLGDPCSSRQKLPERRAPPRSVPRPRPRRLPPRCLIDSARRRRAAGAALAAEKREEAAHLLVVPASSRPDVLRLFRRWGLVAGGFGRCFPGRSGPVSGSTQKKRRCAAGVRLFSSLGPGPMRA